MTPTSLPEALHLHGEICESLHQLILQENRSLKSTGKPTDETLLAAKRTALAELSTSLTEVRARAASGATPESRAAAAKAQHTIVKALLVDRENEQLLLRCDTSARPAPGMTPPPIAQIQKGYAGTF